MAERFHAAPVNRCYVPAFTVEKLEGQYTYTKAERNKNSFGMETSEETADRGYLVTFPRGHSIHVASPSELKRMGFDKTTVPLVDDDGEVMGAIPNQIRTKRVKTDA